MDYFVILVFLILSLVGIVFSAIIFTNGIEHVGDKYGISKGATGSIFAAIATALPETIVPIIAIYAVLDELPSVVVHTNEYQIAMGAMLGAPLMLSTLTIFMIAVFAGMTRGSDKLIKPYKKFATRDLITMIIGVTLLIGISLISDRRIEIAMGAILVAVYCYYLFLTLTDGESVDDEDGVDPLYISKFLKDNRTSAITQSLLSVLGIIIFSKLMVFSIGAFSELATSDFSTHHEKMIFVFVISAIILPIATELPEKINSILWIKKGQDGLAIGNITGALAFQSTVIPAILVFMVPMNLHILDVSGMSIIISLVSALSLLFLIRKDRLNFKYGVLFIVPYLTFIVLSFFMH